MKLFYQVLRFTSSAVLGQSNSVCIIRSMLFNYKVSNFIALQIHGHIKVYHTVASSSDDSHNDRNQDLHNSTHNRNCHNWHRYRHRYQSILPPLWQVGRPFHSCSHLCDHECVSEKTSISWS